MEWWTFAQIAEDEAEIIRLIYDKFIHTNMGISCDCRMVEPAWI